MVLIGCHVSFNNEQLLGSTKEAISYGANTFMFYTGAPQNTVRKEINEKYIKEAKALMEENGIDINNVACHAPYIVNLANAKDLEKYNFSINFIKNELKRCDELGIRQMVIHPGSAVGMTKEEGLNNIVKALNIILEDDARCRVLIETMAGKGNECGTSIDEIAYLVNNVTNKKRIGVCLDTCHLSDAGYDMAKFDDYIKEFQEKLSIDYIGCIHINDSKNSIGSHKDRHANIGKGYIGFDTLLNIIYDERFTNIPKILETPYIGDSDDAKERLYPPYKYELIMIREKKYNDNFLEDIRNEYRKS